MRINEIASAEDQVALWRLVSDSVWQAIETQRQQQAQAEQVKAAKATAKYEPLALYHLTEDPSETKNLAATQPDRVKAMRPFT